LNMKMRKQLTNGIVAVALSTFAWSCNQSDPKPKGDYVDGVFVMTMGNFFENNGSLSFFKREERTADQDVYATANGGSLKGGVQSYAVLNGTGAIAVDNSAAGQDLVEIVDANTMEKIASIGAPDIENPVKVAFASASKLYVSCWGTDVANFSTGYVAVVDLATNRVVKKINVSNGPDHLLINDGKLYVGTVSYGGGRTLSVIDIASDEIVKTVDFDGAPTPIGIDANGRLWVGSGIGLSKVSTDTYAKGTLYAGSDVSKLATNFTFSLDRKTIFFVLTSDYSQKGKTYKVGIEDSQIDVTTPFIDRLFTGLAVDPKQGLIYAGVTPSFVQSGYAVRYRANGTVLDSVKVGANPIGFVFR
jgi:DNA-binding beta-propeller fold protein YncE